MNQELKQRLIGAVVVTALAAIFIPMLFDDPVDDSGQAVSELSIPKVPGNLSEEVGANPPASAGQVPGAAMTAETGQQQNPGATEENANTEENPAQTAENAVTEPSDGEQDGEQAMDTSGDMNTQADNEEESPAEDESAAALDTGVVEEAETPSASVTPHENLKPKPSHDDDDTTVKKTKSPVKPTETAKPKQSAAPKAAPKTTEKTIKPVSKPVKADSELSRWYLQAGTFSKKENASSLSENLRKQGFPVKVETVQIAGKGTMYRLKIGPELDKKRAAAMKATLDKQNIKAILVPE